MINYDRSRAKKLKIGALSANDRMDAHERAMAFYKFIYKLTGSKKAKEKFYEHKSAAVIECSLRIGLLNYELLLIESELKKYEGRP